MAPQASLLGLPRELQDHILDLIVSSRQEAPKDTSNITNRIELNDFKTKSSQILGKIHQNFIYGSRAYKAAHTYATHVVEHQKISSKLVKYPIRGGRIVMFPTLLVNKRLHTETLEAIERSKDLRKWELDIMLVNNYQLWPTWMYMPKFNRRVEQLSLTFRIIESFGTDYCNPYQQHPNVWSQVSWTFYHFLERLLKVGPFGKRSKGVDNRFIVERLIINVSSPEWTEEEHKTTKGMDRAGMVEMWKKKGSPRFIGGRFLAQWLERAVEILANMNHGSAAAFSAILYERVGTIEVQLDGKTCSKWDLGDRLRKLRFDDLMFWENGYDLRPRIYKNWKMDTHELRQRSGLPVEDLDEDELEYLDSIDYAE